MCRDEDSWSRQLWGEVNSGIMSKIMNKPGVSKGGQIVMVTDVDFFFPR